MYNKTCKNIPITTSHSLQKPEDTGRGTLIPRRPRDLQPDTRSATPYRGPVWEGGPRSLSRRRREPGSRRAQTRGSLRAETPQPPRHVPENAAILAPGAQRTAQSASARPGRRFMGPGGRRSRRAARSGPARVRPSGIGDQKRLRNKQQTHWGVC